jgi:hypothetical protein
VRWVKLNVVQLCRIVGRLAPLLILRSVGFYFSKVSFYFYCRFMFALSSFTMTANGLTAGAVAESKERKFIL